MTNLNNLIGKVKKQACFCLKNALNLVDVGILFLSGQGEKLKTRHFQKVFRDAETPEIRIFEVPKLDP